MDGKIWGTLNIYAGEICFFNKEEVKLLDELAGNIGFAIEIRQNEARRLQAENDLKKSVQNWQSIFNAIPHPTVILDSEQHVAAGNSIFEKLTGLDIMEYQNKKCWEIFHDPKAACPPENCPFIKMKNTNIIETYDMEVETLNGFYSVSCTPMFDENGRLEKVIHIATDITGRRKAEEETKRQLQEKELMIKEVHHRIKNNIASIEMLLTLQSNSIKNPEALSLIQDAIRRVQSMRILYENMLISEDYNDVSAKKYFGNIVDSITMIFLNNDRIRIEKKIDDFTADTRLILPLGIIVNELITNSIKYAFPGRESGLIEVIITKSKNKISVIIQDNGIGLPADFDINKSKGFGFILVDMLSKQLGAGFKIESRKGARCTLEVKL